MSIPDPIEGPRFAVKTWQAPRDPHGMLWFARVVAVRPEAAPFTAPRDDARGVVEARRRLPDAVAAAVRRYIHLYGVGGLE